MVAAIKMLDENQINEKLKNVPNYLGTFAINELENLKIRHYPAFLILNMDNRGERGSHWLGIAIYEREIFLCDSLGLINCNYIPKELSTFLNLFLCGRKLHITCQLQWQDSNMCGFYTIFFVLYLQTHTFSQFLDCFSRNVFMNDLLIQLYCK